MADLATMPHLLIAGSTGTGKSVGLNAMLTGILYRATPDDVRMIMVDPEAPRARDVRRHSAPDDAGRRRAEEGGQRACAGRCARWKSATRRWPPTACATSSSSTATCGRCSSPARRPKEGEPTRPLPFIVVVVDELADLMMVAGNEVEESICRLAQMARAVGIHLILATQRPSVDVITGLIKANLPSRISFRVSSKIDSRTILDSNGAEQLLGKGDMLFLPPASSRHIRLHGPYISEQESARLASFLRKQGKPVYDETITEEEKKSGPEGLEFEKDELYDEAARIVVQTGQASISYLQRKMRIGFSRAARLVDMMEAEGLVSAGDRRQTARSARRTRVFRGSGCAASVDGTRACMLTAARRMAIGLRSGRAVGEAADRQGAVRGGAAARRAGARPADQRHERIATRGHRDAGQPGDDVVRIDRAALPHQRLCRQRAVAGASLADAAYQRLNRPEDRDRAMKLYRWLVAGISRELVGQAGQREDRVAEQSAVRPAPTHRICRSPRLPVSLPLRSPAAGACRAVAGTGDAHIDSAGHAARHRPRHPRARQGSAPIAKSGCPVQRECSST